MRPISWEQFFVCNNEAQSIQHRFEDLCRQLFQEEYMKGGMNVSYLYGSYNNPGLETEPVYDKNRKKWIGFQVKFFESGNSSSLYTQVRKSMKIALDSYGDRLDILVLYCNRALDRNSFSFRDIEHELNSKGIELVLIVNDAILDLVRKSPMLGLYYFNQTSISLDFCRDYFDTVKDNLGERYNSHFNVPMGAEHLLSLFAYDIKSVHYLNGIKQNVLETLSKYKKMYEFEGYNSFIGKLYDVVSEIVDIEESNLSDALAWYTRIKEALSEEIVELSSLLMELEESREQLVEEYLRCLSPRDKKQVSFDIDSKIQELNKLRRLLDLIGKFKFDDSEVKAIESKVMVVHGEAGIGKSHLFANQVHCLLDSNRKAIMLLGGNYLSSNSIECQIADELDVDMDLFEVIDVLENTGILNHRKMLVCIDALNETDRMELWKIALPKIIKKINSTKWVRLALSWRTEYYNEIISQDLITKYNVYVTKHYGFENHTIDAVKEFLNYYRIPFSPLLLFRQEINNPLFLTLYCKTYRGEDPHISEIYERLLDTANRNIFYEMNLSSQGYTLDDKLVQSVIYDFATTVFDTGRRALSRDDIASIPSFKATSIAPYEFILKLCHEHILHDVNTEQGKAFVFTYDQMNDFYYARAVIRKCDGKESVREFVLNYILKGIDDSPVYSRVGLFVCICECYSECYNEELLDVLAEISKDDAYNFFLKYLESLQWRGSVCMDIQDLFKYCRIYSVEPGDIWPIFINNSLRCKSSFNANALHGILSRYNISRRDYLWTTYLDELGHSEENRIDEILSVYMRGGSFDLSSHAQVELLLTLLSWFLTSSDRQLRDTTTKVITEILKDDFGLSLVLLRKFENVNDPYVLERLYGAVFGATVRRKADSFQPEFREVVEYVYSSFFSSKKVYPDILMRDYSRLIIERYVYEYGNELFFDLSVIRPPYYICESGVACEMASAVSLAIHTLSPEICDG